MDTKRLMQFKVVATTGNLREAASLLHISHPGLSKAMGVLESELGVRLLSKDGRGIKVTQIGQRLLREMDKCLVAEKHLLMTAQGVQKQRASRVRIGAFEVFSTYFSSTLVNTLGSQSEVVFDELIPGQLEDSLAAGSIDFGITYIPVPNSLVDHVEVTRIQMGVFVNKKLMKVPKKFSDLPFVAPLSRVEGSPTKVKGLDGWPDHRAPRSIRYSVTLMETALELARKGLAAAYLPAFVVRLHNERVNSEHRLDAMAVPENIPTQNQPVYALKRKDSDEDARFRAICRALRALR